MRYFVATLQLVGHADHSDAFLDRVRAALTGDQDAQDLLYAGPTHVIVGPEVSEPEGETDG